MMADVCRWFSHSSDTVRASTREPHGHSIEVELPAFEHPN